jgi:hypothetical protein
VIFQPWMTMLPSASSSQTVGDPLLGESGSTPMKRSDTTAYLSGGCTTLLIKVSPCIKIAKIVMSCQPLIGNADSPQDLYLAHFPW